MLTVEQLIGDLLLQNNCVIIPSFGGFVAQRMSAKIDPVKGVMIPPRKSVLFNKQLINNDGLLIAALSQANSISYTDASHEVQAHILEWEAKLQLGGRITIDRVGNLFYDQERNLCFEQDRFYNLLLESFGLSAVHFVSASDAQAKESHQTILNVVKAVEIEQKIVAPISEPSFVLNHEPIVPVLEVVREESILHPAIAAKKKSTAWRYVAAACLLPIAFYSFWLPVKTDVLESGVISLSDLNPFHRVKQGTYQAPENAYSFKERPSKNQLENLPKNVETFSYEMDEDTYVPVSLNKQQKEVATVQVASTPETPEVVVKETPKPTPAIVPVSNNSKGGVIIVGSYAAKKNAEDLIQLLETNGITAQIVEKDGKIRVTAGNASQFSQLEPKLKGLGITPWILK
ncbi:SPOR domain-containing protein [Fluviicola taffensis]|uniref:Sporulation domain-containing protein n=1 Tax=Fluviicola taffensis (strain DSM 16823 / NCIMB 13979 / RW262) TaxID=755732 RepID=F2IFV4_FLUTR|nr:SPOR domain-containing protein [Fluviicola taffensis]AEA43575.1 Sporulation domain-containing protein [Fluviicola taffensis DSM 16823]